MLRQLLLCLGSLPDGDPSVQGGADDEADGLMATLAAVAARAHEHGGDDGDGGAGGGSAAARRAAMQDALRRAYVLHYALHAFCSVWMLRGQRPAAEGTLLLRARGRPSAPPLRRRRPYRARCTAPRRRRSLA